MQAFYQFPGTPLSLRSPRMTGPVGINTSTPKAPLHVTGQVLLGPADSVLAGNAHQDGGWRYLHNGMAWRLAAGTGGDAALVVATAAAGTASDSIVWRDSLRVRASDGLVTIAGPVTAAGSITLGGNAADTITFTGRLAGAVLWQSDGTHDLGGGGGNRPRDANIARNANIGAWVKSNGLELLSGNPMICANGTLLVQATSTGGANLELYGPANSNAAALDADLTLLRNAAGTNEWLRITSTGTVSHRGNATVIIDASSHLGLRSYTVATLPAASPAGRLVHVSNGNGNRGLAVCDGTVWRWPDGAVVS